MKNKHDVETPLIRLLCMNIDTSNNKWEIAIFIEDDYDLLQDLMYRITSFTFLMSPLLDISIETNPE